MKSQVLANWDMPWLSTFALLIFVTIFITVLFLIFRKDSKKTYQEVGNIPLSEGRNENE